MNILIVDDESYKIKEVRKVIRDIEHNEYINIYHALDIVEAKENLLSHRINLMIIDLNMPEVLGAEPNENGGFDLIDEIISSDAFSKPDDIIILTELEKVEKKSMFPILHYSVASNEWVNTVKNKIEYQLVRYFSTIEENQCCEVAIITAVDIETEALINVITDWKVIEFDNDPTIYYTSDLETDKKKIKIVTAQQSEMGMSSCATLTSKIIHHFNPQYLIMIGIAAGIGNDKEFGDIIFASEVWNYSSGKYVQKVVDDNPYISFIPDPSTINIDAKILAKSKQNFGAELDMIRRSWIDPPNHMLSLQSGPMACGSAVVANAQIVDEMIKQHSRKTIGLDMESYGMFYASQNSNGKLVKPICIKSICDFADTDKGDGFQKYAAFTSASFAKFFILNQLDI